MGNKNIACNLNASATPKKTNARDELFAVHRRERGDTEGGVDGVALAPKRGIDDDIGRQEHRGVGDKGVEILLFFRREVKHEACERDRECKIEQAGHRLNRDNG